LELVGGFASEVGDSVADADLALTLRYAGYRSIFEPRAMVFATSCDVAQPAVGYRSAVAAERLFWRAAPVVGWRRALLAHPATIVAEFIRTLPRPSAFTALAGRIAGACRMRSHRAHHQWLLDVKRAAESLLSIRRRVPARSEKPFDNMQPAAASGRLAA
jgi:hypothetical protein